MECRATRGSTPRKVGMAMTNPELTRALIELIEALDRRMPHVERVGEASIAQDAAALRDKARKRLSEIDQQNASATLDPRR